MGKWGEGGRGEAGGDKREDHGKGINGRGDNFKGKQGSTR
jgi:hypothetical protein